MISAALHYVMLSNVKVFIEYETLSYIDYKWRQCCSPQPQLWIYKQIDLSN